ncbi:MAG: HU family DNA-binding protein [Candidatus Kerfeldbacteria bacterium]|nr:HU family DNA-binding protein [Candidatus Kerfeldbacteria bacterium]
MAEKPMSKSALIAYLAEKSNMSKKDVTTMWELIVDTAYKQAKSAGEVTLPGLGKLIKKNRAARMGRNPATGATIQIPAKTVVKFRVAKAAKDSILGK